MKRLVLARHGESTFNRDGLFTGWLDPDLSPRGVREAHSIGRLLREKGLSFDVAYTSVLRRALRTLFIVLEELDLLWIPVKKLWRLNERHYGALQGLKKEDVEAVHGAPQVRRWRRGYLDAPPPLSPADPRGERRDPRYAGLAPGEVPVTESLKDTVSRVHSVWREEIQTDLREGKRVLICAHGNSLRALIKILESISDEAIAQFELPTGALIAYDLDDDLRPYRRDILAPAATP